MSHLKFHENEMTTEFSTFVLSLTESMTAVCVILEKVNKEMVSIECVFVNLCIF